MGRRAFALLALVPLLAPLAAYAVATLEISPSEVEFDSRCVRTAAGARSFTVTNTDDESDALEVGVQVSPTAAAGIFPLTGPTQRATLAPGEEFDVSVGFRPEAAGRSTASAVVTYQAVVPPPEPSPSSSPPKGSPSPKTSPSSSPSSSPSPSPSPSPSTSPRRTAIPLTGSAIDRFIATAPTSVSFGALPVGRRAGPRALTIYDDGRTPLQVTRLALTGRNARDFTLGNDGPFRVTEQEPATVQIGFRPSAVGSRVAELVIESNSCETPELRVPVGGIGVQPDLITAPLQVDFGSVIVGTPVRAFLDVLNQGGQALTIEEIAITGDEAEAFGLRRVPRLPVELAPGERIEMRVVLGASAPPGRAAAAVAVTSNDPDTPVFEVPLSGQVLEPSPTPSPSPSETEAPPPPPAAGGGLDLALGAYVPEIAVGGTVVGFFVLLTVVRRLRGIPE